MRSQPPFADARDVLRGLARANYHKGGLKTLRLFRVEDGFFARLQEDVRRFVERHQPSEVQSGDHVTHWTKPFGAVLQFSLFNRSGRPQDTSSDHDPDPRGKRFHWPAEYPALAAFIAAFPEAANMRLNGLGTRGGLSPHEEHVVRRQAGRACFLSVRFHLPVRTTAEAEVLLDGELFRLEEGSVFLFNNGCVHSAVNRGPEFRYHLVWDMPLTAGVFTLMFQAAPPPAAFLRRLEGGECAVDPAGRVRVTDYETYGPPRELYDRLRVARVGLPRRLFQRAYNHVDYLRHRLFDRVALHPGLGPVV
jgi:aspartyl/asparaginyl beta-hydroxylase